MQRIFLINLLWQKALSCQAFPEKKKISDKKYDIFPIIFGSSQPTSGIASGILKTKHRTNTERSPPAMPCFSAAQRLRLRNVPPPRKQLQTQRPPAERFLQQTVFSCASRSRTYDGGVKVPCLTAWRWRTGKNQYSRISFICQAKAFCRVCAKCFATLLPRLYSVLVIMRSACPFSALFSQKVLTPPS